MIVKKSISFFIQFYFFHRFRIFPKIQLAKNTAISAATIVAPTGVENKIDRKIPVSAQNTEIIAEQITTLLKFRNTRIAESAGKIISADIKSDPAIFMPMTITTAIITAIKRL